MSTWHAVSMLDAMCHAVALAVAALKLQGAAFEGPAGGGPHMLSVLASTDEWCWAER
jgi:hypothetical protein